MVPLALRGKQGRGLGQGRVLMRSSCEWPPAPMPLPSMTRGCPSSGQECSDPQGHCVVTPSSGLKCLQELHREEI